MLFKLTHKPFLTIVKLSKIDLEVLLKIVLQTLLKVNSKGITKLKNLLAKTAQLKPQTK